MINEKIILTQIPVDELKEIIRSCIRQELDESSGKQEEDELIKPEDASKLLRVSKVTLFKWRRKGILPYHRISSRIYFKKSELLEVLISFKKNEKNYASKK